MKEQKQFNLEEIKKKALEQFRPGESLYGKNGAVGAHAEEFSLARVGALHQPVCRIFLAVVSCKMVGRATRHNKGGTSPFKIHPSHLH